MDYRISDYRNLAPKPYTQGQNKPKKGGPNQAVPTIEWNPWARLKPGPGQSEAGLDWDRSIGLLPDLHSARKVFVGGISYDTTNEDLLAYFQQFGDVTQAQVKYDQATGRSRGFAFVEFGTVAACQAALQQKDREIKSKRVEVKPAKSRENKKVFVGGLPNDFTEEDLKKHFSEYGEVEDIEWPFDRQRNVRRNFAFVVFEEEGAADLASQTTKQKFGDRLCDVKKAVPQPKRFAQGFGVTTGGGGGGGGGARGGGRGGGRGGRGSYSTTGGWGAGTANWYGQGGWGDWYGAGAGAYGGSPYGNYGNYANYYGAGYGSYGGGYYDTDYSSNNYEQYWSGWGQYGAAAAAGGIAGSYDAYGQQAQSPASSAALRGRYQPY